MTNGKRWAYSRQHGQACRIVETELIWGRKTHRVWLPNVDAVVRVADDDLMPCESQETMSLDTIVYAATAARIADAISQDVLLAPLESAVIPLPHQINTLSRAISGDRVRYLLADEVGLGKTIEAGLILRELKLRGLVKRVLVVAPKGLVSQWISEMRTHFEEKFHLILSEDLASLGRLLDCESEGENMPWSLMRQRVKSADERITNPWELFPQVVVSMDSVKPLERRKGWSQEQLMAFNRLRFEGLISADWDLIIVDEAHRLGGSTPQVARHKLGRGLAEAAPYLLMLSATPHQGKSDAFHRLMTLLDEDAFPDIESITKERIKPYVLRTEKRSAIDAQGKTLFTPRRTESVAVAWEAKYRKQKLLYEAVTEYVREGYNRSLREKKTHLGFLMILMQRLVVSSTAAIRQTLQRRLEILEAPEESLPLILPSSATEEWADMDAEEQLSLLLSARIPDNEREHAEVESLLKLTDECEQAGSDAKAEALLKRIYALQAEETDPNLKVLVFTEFVSTQQMLAQFLESRGFEVVFLNGSMDLAERRRAQRLFAETANVLVSTEAGGEGLNLQFCHIVVNYDLPWNPMRIEQRIGRVDRIGQANPVRAVNLALEGSVENRVREILEQKLAIILEEFGVDKTGDVLDSADSAEIFEEAYVEAILDPEHLEDSATSMLDQLQSTVSQTRTARFLLGDSDVPDREQAKNLVEHPLPHWVKRMMIAYVRSSGGDAQKSAQGWEIEWPSGETASEVVFTSAEAQSSPTALHLTLQDSRVRGLIERLPRHTPDQTIPEICLHDLSAGISGIWSIWQIRLVGFTRTYKRLLPLFVSDTGDVFPVTAKRIWDQLLVVDPISCGIPSSDTRSSSFEACRAAAEESGRLVFQEMLRQHNVALEKEREKLEYRLTTRRRAIERLGLHQVRAHRLQKLEQEAESARADLDSQRSPVAEMVPILLLHVQGEDSG
jgi:superfamily II DNA or RNA helicase